MFKGRSALYKLIIYIFAPALNEQETQININSISLSTLIYLDLGEGVIALAANPSGSVPESNSDPIIERTSASHIIEASNES